MTGAGATTDVVIPEALDGERLDRAVALIVDCSRSQAAAIIAAGAVLVDGESISTRSVRLHEGSTVTIRADAAIGAEPPGPESDVGFAVLYEDATVAVIDKPAGLVVHPGAGNRTGTLVNGLLARYPEIADVGDPERPGIVHRLDKGTSGVMMVARTPHAYETLVGALSVHAVERDYVALCWGSFSNDRGAVDAPIGRSARQRQKMTVSQSGRPAITHYQVVRRRDDDPELTLVTCRLETGRTHQIRVHLRAIGHPVIADRFYAPRAYDFVGIGDGDDGRFGLHARQLRFAHPDTGESIGVVAPVPDDFGAAMSHYFGSVAAHELDWQA